MAYSANQTRIFYKTGGSVFAEIDHLMEIPELGGTPEKIDVTALTDTVKKYIPGIKDYGDLVFKFLYDNAGEAANYRVFKGLADSGAAATFKLEYPDKTTHEFDAIPSVKIDAGVINGALTFSVSMLLQSDVTTGNPVD